MEYGFVLDRDLKGKLQGQDQTIQLSDLESSIQRGLDEGTIEWAGGSDFLFHALGVELGFMLCNDLICILPPQIPPYFWNWGTELPQAESKSTIPAVSFEEALTGEVPASTLTQGRGAGVASSTVSGMWSTVSVPSKRSVEFT